MAAMSQRRVHRVPGSGVLTVLALSLLAAGTQIAPLHAAENLPPLVAEQTVLTGLNEPVYVQALPDGRLLLLEKGGAVKLVDPTVTPATQTTVATVAPVQTRGERGLQSVALDPGFDGNGFIYLYYTQEGNGGRNRITRRRLDLTNDLVVPGEVLVWEDNEPAIDCCHYGGGIDFGPDGMLYLTTGEEFDEPQAQDLTRAGGKIIRLDTRLLDTVGPWVRGAANEHIIPDDNPAAIMDGPGGNLDEIWAYGLRNPYRAHWDLVGNRFYIGEVGGNVQTTAREDLHIGRAGANYGWPECEGQCANPAFDDPIYDYPHTGATPLGGAITAGLVYRGSMFPNEYQNVFFFADYALGFIKYLRFDAGGAVTSVNDFATNAGAVVSLESGTDGSLYAVDYFGGRLMRFVYETDNQLPVISDASASTPGGQAPLVVDFTAAAIDPDGEPVTYEWNFGDGTTGAGAAVTKTYATEGRYEARVAVSDGTGSILSDPIVIQVGDVPIARITVPADGTTFRAGTEIDFSASLESGGEDGVTYLWDIDFFHNAHVHPALTLEAPSGTLVIPDSGHDYHDDTGYEFNLTVTDANGLSTTTTSRIRPEKVDLNLATVPAGIPVTVDDIPLQSPIAYDTVIDFRHVVSAPEEVCFDGTQFGFDNWSNDGERVQELVVPTRDVNLTAVYRGFGCCSPLPREGLALHLDAGNGVVREGEVVSAWRDLSVAGNDVVAVGEPRFSETAIGGRPAIDLDGVNDALVRDPGLTGLPAGNDDRSVFAVLQYDGTGLGGVSYGTANDNQTFGLVVDSAAAGSLAIQGWGAQNDFTSPAIGLNAGPLVQSAIYAAGQLRHFRDGEQIDVIDHDFATAPARLAIGSEIDGAPFVDMTVAEVLIYDRALSELERQQVQGFLSEKYFGAPAALAGRDADRIVASERLDELFAGLRSAASRDVRGGRDAALAAIASDVDTTSPSSTSTAEADRASLQPPADGLLLHFDATSGVAHDAGVLASWRGSHDSDHVLTGTGVWQIPNLLNGEPVLAFDGLGEGLGGTGFGEVLPGEDPRTVIALVSYGADSGTAIGWGDAEGDLSFGLGTDANDGRVRLFGFDDPDVLQEPVSGPASGWIVHSMSDDGREIVHRVGTTVVTRVPLRQGAPSSRLAIGNDVLAGDPVAMQLAQLLIYDRALSEDELSEVIDFLTRRYALESDAFGPIPYDSVVSEPVLRD